MTSGRRSRALSLTADWDNVFGKTKDSKVRHPGYSQKRNQRNHFAPAVSTAAIGMASAWRDLEPSSFHTVEYEGMMDNSQFHADGTLIYPMRQKIEGKWEKGKLVSWKYRFIDGLEYEVPWGYCVFPDRRFYFSIQEGLRPAGRELRTNDYVPRPIPEGCYDTGDGFYDPRIKCVVSARDLKKVLRIPTTAEEKWIMHNCRKAWDEPVGYRPDLYKHWTTGRMCEKYDDEPIEEVEEEETELAGQGSSSVAFRYSEVSWNLPEID